MPPRGSPGLWPVRILTEFGKDAYVLWISAAMLLAVDLVRRHCEGPRRSGC